MKKRAFFYFILLLSSSIACTLASDIQIEKIISDYEIKPGEFNQLYKGKFLKFRGVISEISDDVLEKGFYNISIDVAGSDISCRKVPKSVANELTERELVDIHGKIDDVFAVDLGMVECDFVSVVSKNYSKRED